MGIATLTMDYNVNSSDTTTKKKRSLSTNETESFGKTLQAETEKKCPYGFLAKDGVINYNGVVFVCDYKQNAITLGNMYEKEKVLKIALPSGGSLHVNVDNIDQLANAASMFTPEDLNAIMRAIHEYNHCTRKRMEIEEEKAESAEEAAEESETPDTKEEPEFEEGSLAEQINSYKIEMYYRFLHNENVKQNLLP